MKYTAETRKMIRNELAKKPDLTLREFVKILSMV